jgi:DNA-binding PadR family transcriptional regulator
MAAGELRLLLLSLIAERPRHGYDLIRAVEDLTGGAYAPSPGVVYPALAMLDDQGMVAANTMAEGGRKAFAITSAGAAEVADKGAEIATLTARLRQSVTADFSRSAPVRRAMDNLKAVLGTALAEGGDERPHEIAALIDTTAQAIERLR